MSFKVGHNKSMAIANVADKSKEAELKRHDVNNDGILNMEEASRYYASKTGGQAPRTIDDVFKLAGGRQHDIDKFHQDHYSTLYTHAPNWKGDFNVPGMGAGNVRTGRTSWGNQDRLQVLVDCDLMNRDFLEKNLSSATLMIGPKGFKPEQGSDLGEAVAVPMDIATRKGYQSWNRGGGSTFVPEKKHLAVSLETADLRKLAGGGELSFYVRLETNDGKTHFINKDGQAFNNFGISAGDIKDVGRP